MKRTSTNCILFGFLLIIAALFIQSFRWPEFFNLVGLHVLTSSGGFVIGLALLVDLVAVLFFLLGMIIGCYGFFKKVV